MLLLSSLLGSYHYLVTTLLVGKDKLKMEDAIFAILENEKLRKLTNGFRGIAYVVSDGHDQSIYRCGRLKGSGTYRSSFRVRIDYSD